MHHRAPMGCRRMPLASHHSRRRRFVLRGSLLAVLVFTSGWRKIAARRPLDPGPFKLFTVRFPSASGAAGNHPVPFLAVHQAGTDTRHPQVQHENTEAGHDFLLTY